MTRAPAARRLALPIVVVTGLLAASAGVHAHGGRSRAVHGLSAAGEAITLAFGAVLVLITVVLVVLTLRRPRLRPGEEQAEVVTTFTTRW